MDIQVDVLRNYVEKIAKKVLDEENNLPVVSGVIQSSEPGVYKVQLSNGNETGLVEAESLYVDKTFLKDDYVYLVKAETNRGSDYGKKYFIVGLVTTVQQNFANLSDKERFIGDKVTYLVETEEITNTDFLNAFRVNGVAAYSAKVTTGGFSKIKDFGLEFTFVYDDESTKVIKFSGAGFVGQPFYLTNSAQKKILNIGPNNTVKKIIISKYGADAGETFNLADASLECGTLLNVADDFSVDLENISGKTSFNKSADNGAVQIKANVKYGNQKLDTNGLKYYWYVKRHDGVSVSSLNGADAASIDPFGQTEWVCVNEWDFAKTYENDDYLTFAVYQTHLDTLTIDYTKANSYNWLPKYENEIKCIVGYQLANKESKPIKLYNFNHEEFDAEISFSEDTSLPLIDPSETATVEVKVTSPTVPPTNLKYVFNFNGETIERDTNFITFCFVKDEDDEDKVVLGEDFKTGMISCVVKSGENEIATTKELTLTSYVTEQDKIEEVKTYYYCIREKSALTGEEIWTKATDGLENISLFEEGEFGTRYLFYYILTEFKHILDGTVLRSEETKKSIYRVEVKENASSEIVELPEAGVEQLNTFNSLTNNGNDEGFYFENKGTPNQKLYINASYIKTGALKVSKFVENENGEQEEQILFNADVENPAVQIGGFDVTENSIKNGEKVVLSTVDGLTVKGTGATISISPILGSGTIEVKNGDAFSQVEAGSLLLKEGDSRKATLALTGRGLEVRSEGATGRIYSDQIGKFWQIGTIASDSTSNFHNLVGTFVYEYANPFNSGNKFLVIAKDKVYLYSASGLETLSGEVGHGFDTVYGANVNQKLFIPVTDVDIDSNVGVPNITRGTTLIGVHWLQKKSEGFYFLDETQVNGPLVFVGPTATGVDNGVVVTIFGI